MPPPPKPRRGPAARPPVEIKVEENIQKEISVNEAAENAEEVLPVVFPVCPHPAKRSAPVSKSVAIDNVLFFIIRKSPLFFVVQTIV